jgi:SPFH domain / Band 7 family
VNIPWARIIATLAIVGFWWTTSTIITIAGAPVVNEIAGHQFDSTYGWQLTLGSIRTVGIMNNAALVVYGLILLAIWAPWLKSLWREIFATFGMLSLVLACSPHAAQAYRYKTDYSEVYTAKTDETVFLVPLFGDKIKQGMIRSEQFYKDNMASTSYVLIPHAKLPGSGTVFDDVVNSAQAIVVKRRPIAREWVASLGRGSSTRDESFHCETAESHNISTDITFAGMIEEANAAKYLYYSGVDSSRPLATSQSGTDTDKDPNFVSAVAAMSIEVFTDTFGRRIVGAELCKQFAARSTDEVIAKKSEIIAAVRDEVSRQLATMGVTVTNLGFAGPINFDSRIQGAIDETYIAKKRALVATTLTPAIPALEKQARIEVMLGFAEALKNGKLPALPSFVGAIPPEVIDAFRSYAAHEAK